MDRRSLLKMFAVAGAAAAVLHPTMGEAMPIAPKDGVAPVPPTGGAIGDSAVAHDADMEAVGPEKTYWGRRRRYYRRRYFWRPRFYRRRYFWRPRYRFHRRRWWY